MTGQKVLANWENSRKILKRLQRPFDSDMLPYQAAVAMDYAGYQRQPTPGHPGSHMATMGSLGMPAVPFSHSWMVPTQDLCAMPPYNKMPGHQQPPGPGMHAQQQPIEPGLVNYL